MISYFRSLSHVKRALLKSVIVINVKCYNIIQPQHVKCKQNDEWAKYCAFGLENMERRKPKNRGKSRKACQETTLPIPPPSRRDFYPLCHRVERVSERVTVLFSR